MGAMQGTRSCIQILHRLNVTLVKKCELDLTPLVMKIGKMKQCIAIM